MGHGTSLTCSLPYHACSNGLPPSLFSLSFFFFYVQNDGTCLANKERVWQCGCGCFSKSVFGSVVAGAFQIAFRAEIHVNDVFSFFKNYFWHQHIKTIQKVQTALNFNKKKNSKFDETQLQIQCQTVPKFRFRPDRERPLTISFPKGKKPQQLGAVVKGRESIVSHDHFHHAALFFLY